MKKFRKRDLCMRWKHTVQYKYSSVKHLNKTQYTSENIQTMRIVHRK